MRAAIYARFSSELQKESSIDDQNRLCRDFARSEGMTVAALFEDRAKSGGSMQRRLGIQGLLRAAKGNSFNVVIVESLDRLSRDQEDLAHIYKQLKFHGVEIRTVHEGRADHIQIGVRGLVGALYLKDLAEKVHRGQTGVVLDGRSGGGQAYGYRPTPGAPGVQRIVEEEAAIVRRIFESYASGRTPKVIAGELNAEGVPAPRGKTWLASTIRGNKKRGAGILRNQLYAGRIVWNKNRMISDPASGQRLSRPRDASEHVEHEAPHLRIVDQEVYDAVQTRLTESSKLSNPYHHRPKHLLSGLLKCGHCGGGMSVKDRRKGVVRVQCTQSREGGRCNQRTSYILNDIERTVLGGLLETLQEPQVIEAFVSEYHAEMQRMSADTRRERRALERRRTSLASQNERMVDALATGSVDISAIRERLESNEGELAEVTARLEALDREDESNVVQIHPATVDRYLHVIAELRNHVTGEDVDQESRDALRLLVGSVTVDASMTPGARMNVQVQGLLSGLTEDPASVSILGGMSGSGGET